MLEGAAHFAPVAQSYARYRLTYPPALFEWLASLAPSRERAWDCGCGNGQAALGLVDYFDEIVATDAGDSQIASATAHPKVRYRVAPAEDAGLDDDSIDLVLVAQALHWFDLPQFYQEVRRVARPGAVIAAVTYGLMRARPDLQAVIERFYNGAIHPYWPPERAHVDDGYARLDFPFAAVAPPAPPAPMTVRRDMTVDDLCGFFGTWSAVTRYRQATGKDPVADLRPALQAVWGTAAAEVFHWPLRMRVGRVS